ncbi:MAG: GGDEF domain-containing protein [Lachnospiraceae bacterium]|nr:GGDEF domain-containing protein [Lachnospiraceae bacterium]
MYTVKELEDYEYFVGQIGEHGIENMLDSLTGVLARKFIEGFVRYLIEKEIPFTFGIVDLDNFKFINDTYGHKAGDKVLQSVAENLERVLYGCGVVGRFGGDEFVFVDLVHLDYYDKKNYISSFYLYGNVLRRNVSLGDFQPFVTGTVGCASFPEDARDYDDLFMLIDKTLYRGKTKGRNCYIIYVEEKHKDIVIKDLAGHGLFATFKDMMKAFDSSSDVYEKLKAVFGVLQEDMRITDLYYVGRSRQVKSVSGDEAIADIPDIDNIVSDEVFSSNNIVAFRKVAPKFYSFLEGREIETVLIARMGMGPMTRGFIFCAEPRNRRIWQDDEFAILFSVARMLTGYIMGRNIDFD